jgi:N-hydroxyarylamine O-acetyltransferase
MTTGAIDLPAYLDRIGCPGEWPPTLETLNQLHLYHTTRITFENLDILQGRPIRIDLNSIQAKLVTARRGGYCFEQNRLFAAVLEAIGFSVTFLAARVRYRSQRTLPRTHVLLKVEVGRRPWIADVGFGTVGPLQPIPLMANKVREQFGVSSLAGTIAWWKSRGVGCCKRSWRTTGSRSTRFRSNRRRQSIWRWPIITSRLIPTRASFRH